MTAVAVVGGAGAAMLGAVADDQIRSEIVPLRRASRGFARYVAGEELLAVQERRRRRR